jgi:hypothetical protein
VAGRVPEFERPGKRGGQPVSTAIRSRVRGLDVRRPVVPNRTRTFRLLFPRIAAFDSWDELVPFQVPDFAQRFRANYATRRR